MTEAPYDPTTPPIFEYAVITGTCNNVEQRLTKAGQEGWLLNGMSTCVIPSAEGDPTPATIVMTCVVMRQEPPGDTEYVGEISNTDEANNAQH